jgi:uncharacterized membrane protein YgcG
LIGALDEVISKAVDSNSSSTSSAVATITTSNGPLNQSIYSQSDRLNSAPQYAKKYMGDVRNIAALRMTEVYEWSLEKGLERLQQQATAAASSSAPSATSSLVNMLGMRKTEQLSPNPLAEMSLARPSSDSVLKSRTYLCSYKFRYAMVLCDFGLTAEALEYALDIRNFINFVNQRSEPMKGKPPINSGKSSSGAAANECSTPSKPQPFSKGFVNTVNEFIDRLSGGNSKNNATGGASGQGGVGGSSSSGSGSGSGSWNVWNMLNSTNLKDLVDGPTEKPPTASKQQQQQPPPSSNQKMAPPPLGSSVGPPLSGTNSNHNYGNRSPNTSATMSSQNGNSLAPPPTSMSSIPPSNQGPPLMMPGPAPPLGSNHSSAMGPPPGLKSSSSTGDLRDNFFSTGPPIDNSLAAAGHSISNPSSHSGGAAAVPPSQPQHRKQHSADATMTQPSKTSPSKAAAAKKTGDDKNIITSVSSFPHLPPSSLSPLSLSPAGEERVARLALPRCS